MGIASSITSIAIISTTHSININFVSIIFIEWARSSIYLAERTKTQIDFILWEKNNNRVILYRFYELTRVYILYCVCVHVSRCGINRATVENMKRVHA